MLNTSSRIHFYLLIVFVTMDWGFGKFNKKISGVSRSKFEKWQVSP